MLNRAHVKIYRAGFDELTLRTLAAAWATGTWNAHVVITDGVDR